MVSERGGAKKLSFNFKNSNLTLTSTSRPNPFKVKTSHGQWTTEKKSVGKWRKNRNEVKRTMASLSYLSWHRTRSYNGGGPCRRGRSGRFNREVAWNQAPLEGRGGGGRGKRNKITKRKRRKRQTARGTEEGQGKGGPGTCLRPFPLFSLPLSSLCATYNFIQRFPTEEPSSRLKGKRHTVILSIS